MHSASLAFVYFMQTFYCLYSFKWLSWTWVPPSCLRCCSLQTLQVFQFMKFVFHFYATVFLDVLCIHCWGQYVCEYREANSVLVKPKFWRLTACSLGQKDMCFSGWSKRNESKDRSERKKNQWVYWLTLNPFKPVVLAWFVWTSIFSLPDSQ